MSGKPHAAAVLGEFEQLVLFAALRLGDESYGAFLAITAGLESELQKP